VYGSELEIGRSISFGLLDVLTLPQRRKTADAELARQELFLTTSVVTEVTQVRQAWVRAVAAKQNLAYAAQVQESAQASAELARRMLAVGNFTRLQRARQHAFYADATTQWAAAQHADTAAREALVRALGLRNEQTAVLQLPARLPDLPKQTITPQVAARSATDGRLDIRLAQAALRVQAATQGLENINSLGDVELGLRADTVFDNAAATTTARTGFQLNVRVPLFDTGDQRRAAMNARTLAAAQRLEASARAAGSHLRESYSAYRTAWDIAAHYRDDVLPTQQLIGEENLLRYSGMIIGVFELLADARAQTASVMAAIAAQEQFWLAEAALQSTLIGQPLESRASGPAASKSTGGNDAGH
jgi:outer membrane protein TolC